MASEIYDVARDLPPLAQRRLLEAIGSTSHAAIEIARWLGMGLLLPGCLNDISVSVSFASPLRSSTDVDSLPSRPSNGYWAAQWR
jgi:hypothetical protein